MDSNVKEILSKLTVKQKANLLYGKKFWYLHGSSSSEALPDIMLTDGPSGLRKQNGKADMIGINDSVPATAFPTGSAIACSWDRELLYELGCAIGNEAAAENVSVVLGPAVNIMRDPLCGRNFEYLSEDPYLAGKLGAAYVNGLQSKGVGASVKHFAANSREDGRMFCDSVIDERALREIYLKPFEIIVKESQPFTIMTAYNKVNGVHCAQNKKLMTDIARGEWGYKGIFLTDWGAMREQIESYKAGLDLEMPGTCGSDEDIERAVACGQLDEEVLNEHAERVINLLLNSKNKAADVGFKPEDNLIKAQRFAEECAVLLKNDGILPMKEGDDYCVIGGFAEKPRYQGGGSSKTNPRRLDSFLEYVGTEAEFSRGYGLSSDETDAKLIQNAVEAAKRHKYAVVFAGLTDLSESEGYDRKTLDMPASHNALIEAVSRVNKNTVVVLFGGSPVVMPWVNAVKGILHMHLGGCMSGKVTYNLLFGKANPCGKLTQTFPVSYGDCPSASYYGKDEDFEEYRESVFTGYRFYDTAKRRTLFPFGFGLSYTRFSYSEISAEVCGDKVNVSFSLANVGDRDGKEIVQLYVSHKNPTFFKAKKELKEFAKITLKKGQSKRVDFELGRDAFAFYNDEAGEWQVEKGEYQILIGASAEDIRLETTVFIDGVVLEENPQAKSLYPAYFTLEDHPYVPEEHFLALAKVEQPKTRDKTNITLFSPIKDLQYSAGGKEIFETLKNRAEASGNKADFLTAMDMPVINTIMNSDRTRAFVYELLKNINTKK
ncbi:MAG: beta-glucosidase [Candidatus Coproplasma sp.]